MSNSDAASKHAEQNVPKEWSAIDVDGRTIIVHDPADNGADAYLLTVTSRNVRTFARADAALVNGNVVEPVYDDDTRTVEFIHHWAGRVGRKSVAEFFDEPAARLKRLPEMPEHEVLQA